MLATTMQAGGRSVHCPQRIGTQPVKKSAEDSGRYSTGES